MKIYRKKEPIIIWKYTGDISIINEINKIIEDKKDKIDGIYDCYIKDNIIFIVKNLNEFNSISYVRIGQYIMFNLDLDKVLSIVTEDIIDNEYIQLF